MFPDQHTAGGPAGRFPPRTAMPSPRARRQRRRGGARPAPSSPDTAGVDHRPRPDQLPGRPQLLQNDPISDHSSSESPHGRKFPFPTNGPMSIHADSHKIIGFCEDLLRQRAVPRAPAVPDRPAHDSGEDRQPGCPPAQRGTRRATSRLRRRTVQETQHLRAGGQPAQARRSRGHPLRGTRPPFLGIATAAVLVVRLRT